MIFEQQNQKKIPEKFGKTKFEQICFLKKIFFWEKKF